MNKIELRPAEVDREYLKKWQVEGIHDFVQLYANGKRISDQLYRIGGFHHRIRDFGANTGDQYFMIIKYMEELYDKSIVEYTKNKNRKYLASYWCIIDNNGEEKQVFDSFKIPYLKGGMIYSIDDRYYNIETSELICKSDRCVTSEEYLFLQNDYDKDHSRRGVIQVKKSDGSYVIIK